MKQQMKVLSLMVLMLTAVCSPVQAQSADSSSAGTQIENNTNTSSAPSNIFTEDERNAVDVESPPTAADDNDQFAIHGGASGGGVGTPAISV
jgi:hypothetical protein